MAYSAFLILLPILMVDAVIEVGFVGSMVGFLHDRAGRTFTIDWPQQTFELNGKPKGLLVNQGHTSNGAAGTALILVGVLGLLTIWWERRKSSSTRYSSHLFVFWTTFTVLSALLTAAALIYTFIVTYQTNDQSISLPIAAASVGLAYPNLNWTPENWFDAVLALPLASESDRSNIRTHLLLMRGWRWNLIPLLVLGWLVAGLNVAEVVRGRRSVRRGNTNFYRTSFESGKHGL